MSLPTFTIDDIISWNPCVEFQRPVLASLLGEGPITALAILTEQARMPDGSSPSMQDRLWSIMRAETVTTDGLAALDAWVTSQFASIDAATTGGQNCKNQWPQPTEFRRAVMLSDLMRHETGSDAAFVSGISEILNGI